VDITGTQLIPAPRDAVWQALNDPEVLKRCLPGCESVERVDEHSFKVVVAAAIGPLRARFNGSLRMTESRAPESCVMVFEGQGGAVGFGKGSSTVALRETADGTELTYSAQAQVGGKLAQVGSRLVEGVARKMSDDFFKAFKKQLAPAEPVAATSAAAPAKSPAPASIAADTSTVDRTASPPVASTPASHAERPAAAIAPVAYQPQPDPDRRTLVPGWWLAVAAVIGSVATLAGNLLAH
jgi:carbon monoxide dehydrogenase subunit G